MVPTIESGNFRSFILQASACGSNGLNARALSRCAVGTLYANDAGRYLMDTDNHERERSIPELLRRLSEETSALVRAELALARVELVEHGKQIGAGAGFLGVSTILALGAFGALTAFLILGLIALGVLPWLAALSITIVYGIAAAVSALAGKKKLTAGIPPAPQTVQTLREDVQWAKTQARSGRK